MNLFNVLFLMAVIGTFANVPLVEGTCYNGVCSGATRVNTGVDRFIQEEHGDLHTLAASGVWWALAGFLVAIGYSSKTYFTILAENGGICSFNSLVAWVFSIWAVLTVVFVGTALIIAFTL